MSDNLNKPDHGDQMESFFDNLMSEKEAAEFLAERQLDRSFMSQWELQQQIDDSLKGLFHFETPVPANANVAATTDDHAASLSANQDNLRMLKLVLAASLIGLLCWFAWQYRPGADQLRVVFQDQPLTTVYNATVDAGFKPYYLCEDMERFAGTFKHRHGVAVTLSQMPEDRMMLGLSYMGGVSREATAMLCTVQGQPVLVFVDTTANDPGQLTKSTDPDLNIFREQKFGLVFYEVTPLDEPTMIQFFEFADDATVSD